jgi:hypothetical protein
MFMTFSASKRNMLIIDDMDPLCVFVCKTNGVGQDFGYVHVDVDPGI